MQKNVLLGDANYRQAPELEVMRQGQGIIDIVNSYVNIILNYGIVGLCLFFLIFLSLLLSTARILKMLPPDNGDLIRAGRSLFAVLCSILFMIATVSSIDYVPVLYWTIAAITAAYIYVAKNVANKSKTTDYT